MTFSDLRYLWGSQNCYLWAVFLDNGQEITDDKHPLSERFVNDFHKVRRGWLFLEYMDGNNKSYMKVYRIDGSFLWEYK
jgi:hypothetical protein